MNAVTSILFFVAVVATVSAGCSSVPSCPEDYLTWGSNCYKLYNKALTWEAAEACCVQDGAHLASIHSASEDNYLNVLSQEGTAGNKQTYVGFNDRNREGNFVWTDGSPVDYTNWHSGEPNNSGGEDCTEFNYFDLDGTWNDLPCSQGTHRFICKM